jgi:ankyrin repeat protein
MENDMHFVSILIEYGADINEIYNYGRMPLHLCIERHFNDLSKLLLEHGADIEAVDYGGSNAVALASQYGFGVEMIRLESCRRADQPKVESK